MKRKIRKLFLLGLFIFLMVIGIVISDKYSCSIVAAILGALLSKNIEYMLCALEDLFDTSDWKTSQTKLKRGGFIKDDTIIRISFAYLYRIKVDGKYFLVQNSRNTGKYQPVGGVYKLQKNEKIELKKLFHIMDDDKIPIDQSSRDDYRMRMENRYLRKFITRFNSKKSSRERITNLSREFKEELIDNNILNWNSISYRYCGRHITNLRFEEHFQCYEIQLFDVVELIPTASQERELKNLMNNEEKQYCFATANEIMSLGVDIPAGKLYERIGDHTKNILQENETKLIKMYGVEDVYEVQLKES